MVRFKVRAPGVRVWVRARATYFPLNLSLALTAFLNSQWHYVGFESPEKKKKD